jgi:hypothetical protein
VVAVIAAVAAATTSGQRVAETDIRCPGAGSSGPSYVFRT